MTTYAPGMKALETRIAQDYGESPSAIASQYGLDPNLFLGLIQTESSGDAKALSRAGAAGLTQLMPDTARELGITPDERFDPWQSMDKGAKYLRQQLDRFGNAYDALRAYNVGPGAAANDPNAGALYATKVLESAGMGDAIPDNVKANPPKGVVGRAIADGLDTVKGYGYSALIWLVIGALVLFGVYGLATGKAVASVAA